jgi:hypothetical protein
VKYYGRQKTTVQSRREADKFCCNDYWLDERFTESGESPNDFIHKIKVVLKELRETLVCLKILYRTKLFKSEDKMKAVLKETDELVAIFVTSVKTAERARIGNRKKE